MNGIKKTISTLVTLLMVQSVSATEVVQPEETFVKRDLQSVKSKQFMVSSANPLASEIGYQILKDGGSAADAAIAVQLMLNLVEPQSSGIGGGAFALYWDAKAEKLITYDGREKAPSSATEAYWLGEDGNPKGWRDAVVGGRSVGVPGTLKLLETLHTKHGNMEWEDLFTPTIKLAESGFDISPRLASSIAKTKESNSQLDLFEPTRRYFFTADGKPKSAGQQLINTAFADTLRLIAKEGVKPFYEGSIAEGIVSAVNTETNPGEVTLEDLANYQVIERQAVCLPYRAYEVCGMGPPTSGGIAVGQILSVLSQFDLPSFGPSAKSWHLYAEAAKLAYADRGRYVADSDFIDVPVEPLLDPAYNAERAKLINLNNSMGKALPGTPVTMAAKWADDTQLEQPGTSHFVIVDKQGNMISMTTTIETGFGSRVMTGGFLLNNEMTDFSFIPEKDGNKVANRVEANKRPRSSMAPTMVFKNGQPYLLIGSPGGSRIINYVAQALVAILDWNLDPQDAINMGHVVNRNGVTDLEEATKVLVYESPLKALGHQLSIRNLNSGLHAILIKEDEFIGAADPRREGIVMGD